MAAIWGFAFVATRIGLDSFSAPQLAALRFLVAAVPALVVPRPPIPWSVLVPIGLTLFAGQFLFQFFGIASGMPPGLASITVQTQAFFTILFAALALGERVSPRQLGGMAVALGGLVFIALTVGQGLTAIGLGLTLAAAVSWSIGNVLLKQIARVEMLPLIVWLSLIPPLPAWALSMVLDGPVEFARRVVSASWLGLGAALYLGLVATVLAYDGLGRSPAALPGRHRSPRSRCWRPWWERSRPGWCSASNSGRCAPDRHGARAAGPGHHGAAGAGGGRCDRRRTRVRA